MKTFTLIVATVVVAVLFMEVRSQRNCCRRCRTCSCCRTTYNTSSSVRICSSTCADISTTCSGLTTLCNSSLYYTIMLATCPCTCGLCSATTATVLTGACAGLAVGAPIGPCNTTCQTGFTCSTTLQACVSTTDGVTQAGPCVPCPTPATCTAGQCLCLSGK